MELRQQKKLVAAPCPLPVSKVDQCIARLRELQHTARSGGTKSASGFCLRMAKDYSNPQCSPPAKLSTVSGDGASWPLSAVLLRETVGEISRASRFARSTVEAVSKTSKARPAHYGPKTPIKERIKQKQSIEASSGLQAPRKRDKQVVLPLTIRSERDASNLQRAKSNISLRMSTLQISDCDKENKCNYAADRVSPRTRPWVTKAVLFPNPLFESLPDEQTPYKFSTKSPQPAALGIHGNIKSPTRLSNFQTRARRTRKKSSPLPFLCTNADKLRRSMSPSRLASRLAAPFKRESYYRKMRCDGVQKWC